MKTKTENAAKYLAFTNGETKNHNFILYIQLIIFKNI